MTDNSTYIIFEELREIGFAAGVTLKGPWGKQQEVYDFVKQNIVPSNYRIVSPKQVHGNEIITVTDKPDARFVADGTMTDQENICLTVSSADCVPLLVADAGSGWFGAIHVGWRSYVSGILENLSRTCRELPIDIGNARFITGPSLGSCCFEVGAEVAGLFDKTAIVGRGGSQFIDLRGAARDKLISAGAAEANIGGSTDCTSCKADMYYSYRREKKSPVQMVTFIYRTAV